MTDSARDCVAAISTKRVYPPFGQVLRTLFPPGTKYKMLVEFFDNRVPYHTIRNWIRGQAGPPEWAVELVRRRIETGLGYLNQTKIGPGQKAGTENLRKWHARKKD